MSLKEERESASLTASASRLAGKKNLQGQFFTDGYIESINLAKCEYVVRLVDRKETVKAYLAFNKNFWLITGFPQLGERVLVTHDGKMHCRIMATFDTPETYALEDNLDYEDNCLISEGVNSAG